jgi:hypothetical protein
LPEGRRKGLPSNNGRASRCSALTADELAAAETRWIRATQASHYKRELRLISDNQLLSGKSALTNLSSILDLEGVLRVGGWLEQSPLPYDEKHPIILPVRSLLAKLVVEACHRRTLHGGPQLTLGLVRQKF